MTSKYNLDPLKKSIPSFSEKTNSSISKVFLFSPRKKSSVDRPLHSSDNMALQLPKKIIPSDQIHPFKSIVNGKTDNSGVPPSKYNRLFQSKFGVQSSIRSFRKSISSKLSTSIMKNISINSFNISPPNSILNDMVSHDSSEIKKSPEIERRNLIELNNSILVQDNKHDIDYDELIVLPKNQFSKLQSTSPVVMSSGVQTQYTNQLENKECMTDETKLVKTAMSLMNCNEKSYNLDNLLQKYHQGDFVLMNAPGKYNNIRNQGSYYYDMLDSRQRHCRLDPFLSLKSGYYRFRALPSARDYCPIYIRSVLEKPLQSFRSNTEFNLITDRESDNNLKNKIRSQKYNGDNLVIELVSDDVTKIQQLLGYHSYHLESIDGSIQKLQNEIKKNPRLCNQSSIKSAVESRGLDKLQGYSNRRHSKAALDCMSTSFEKRLSKSMDTLGLKRESVSTVKQRISDTVSRKDESKSFDSKKYSSNEIKKNSNTDCNGIDDCKNNSEYMSELKPNRSYIQNKNTTPSDISSEEVYSIWKNGNEGKNQSPISTVTKENQESRVKVSTLNSDVYDKSIESDLQTVLIEPLDNENDKCSFVVIQHHDEIKNTNIVVSITQLTELEKENERLHSMVGSLESKLHVFISQALNYDKLNYEMGNILKKNEVLTEDTQYLKNNIAELVSYINDLESWIVSNKDTRIQENFNVNNLIPALQANLSPMTNNQFSVPVNSPKDAIFSNIEGKNPIKETIKRISIDTEHQIASDPPLKSSTETHHTHSAEKKSNSLVSHPDLLQINSSNTDKKDNNIIINRPKVYNQEALNDKNYKLEYLVQNLKTELKGEKKKYETLRLEMDNLSKAYHDKSTFQKRKIQEQFEKIESLEEQVQRYRSQKDFQYQFEEASIKHSAAETKVQILNQKMNDLVKLYEERLVEKSKNIDIMREKQKMNLTTIQEVTEENLHLKEELSHTTKLLEEAESAIINLKPECKPEYLELLSHRAKNTDNQIQNLNKQLTDLKEEKKIEQEKKNAVKEDLNATLSKLNKLEVLVDQINQELDQKTKEVADTNYQRIQLEKELQILKLRNQYIESCLTEQTEVIDKEKSKVVQLLKNSDQLKATITAVIEKYEHFRNELINYEAKYQKECQLNNELTKQIEQLSNIQNISQHKIDDLTDDSQNIKNQLLASSNALATQTNEIEKLRRILIDKDSKIDSLIKQVQSLEEDLLKKNTYILKLDREQINIQQKLSLVNEEKEFVQVKLENYENMIHTLRMQVDEYKFKLLHKDVNQIENTNNKHMVLVNSMHTYPDNSYLESGAIKYIPEDELTSVSYKRNEDFGTTCEYCSKEISFVRNQLERTKSQLYEFRKKLNDTLNEKDQLIRVLSDKILEKNKGLEYESELNPKDKSRQNDDHSIGENFIGNKKVSKEENIEKSSTNVNKKNSNVEDENVQVDKITNGNVSMGYISPQILEYSPTENKDSVIDTSNVKLNETLKEKNPDFEETVANTMLSNSYQNEVIMSKSFSNSLNCHEVDADLNNLSDLKTNYDDQHLKKTRSNLSQLGRSVVSNSLVDNLDAISNKNTGIDITETDSVAAPSKIGIKCNTVEVTPVDTQKKNNLEATYQSLSSFGKSVVFTKETKNLDQSEKQDVVNIQWDIPLQYDIKRETNNQTKEISENKLIFNMNRDIKNQIDPLKKKKNNLKTKSEHKMSTASNYLYGGKINTEFAHKKYQDHELIENKLDRMILESVIKLDNNNYFNKLDHSYENTMEDNTTNHNFTKKKYYAKHQKQFSENSNEENGYFHDDQGLNVLSYYNDQANIKNKINSLDCTYYSNNPTLTRNQNNRKKYNISGKLQLKLKNF